MNGREFWALRDVSDEQLEVSLSRLLGAGARLEARIVAHLAEVDARRLHLTLGCSSLYDYCRKRLGLSDYEAFSRIAAARVARKYPVVFEMLERRQVHLTALCEVREFLTTENHRELLGEVSGKTKTQIREVLAHHFPQADLRSSLKKLPALEPLSPGRYRLLVTLSAQQKEKLELARDLLSHANPSGDLAIVLERAVDELIARLEKRRFGRLGTRKSPRTVDSSKVAHAKGRTVELIEPPVPIELSVTAEQPVMAEQPAPIEPSMTAEQPVMAEQPAPIEISMLVKQPKPVEESPPSERAGRGETSARVELGEVVEARERLGQAGARVAPTQGGRFADREHVESLERHSPSNRARGRKHIAHETRRQLLERDGCGCAFVGSDGQRCAARAFLQFHHRRAWAHGGPDSADNLQVLCRAHNRLLAERDFGRVKVERAIADQARAGKRLPRLNFG